LHGFAGTPLLGVVTQHGWPWLAVRCSAWVLLHLGLHNNSRSLNTHHEHNHTATAQAPRFSLAVWPPVLGGRLFAFWGEAWPRANRGTMNRRLSPPHNDEHAEQVARYVSRTEDTEHEGTRVRLYFMHDGTVQTHVIGCGFTVCACGCGSSIEPIISCARMLMASETDSYWRNNGHKQRAWRNAVAVLNVARERLLRTQQTALKRTTAERNALALEVAELHAAVERRAAQITHPVKTPALELAQ
jgi:hypothetical protein